MEMLVDHRYIVVILLWECREHNFLTIAIPLDRSEISTQNQKQIHLKRTSAYKVICF